MNAPLTLNPKPPRMMAEEFVAWAIEQPLGRYELVEGEVVQMAAERLDHVRTKTEAAFAFHAAIRAAGLNCDVMGDGMAIKTGAGSVFEPDLTIRCGPPLPPETLLLPDPLIVVEVISPSTWQVDTGTKFNGYFSVPSIRHYLIVHPVTRAVIHHRHAGQDEIVTRLLHAPQRDDATSVELVLDPPGLTFPVAHLFEAP